MKFTQIKNRFALPLVVIFVIFMFPLLSGIAKDKKWDLKGAYVQSTDSALTADRWFSGSYQANKDKFLTENFSLHTFCVQLYAQLQFLIFHKSTAYGVIVGTDNYLYEEGYVFAYYGRTFAGAAYLKDQVLKLKQINDTLAKLHKVAVMVLAPGKASYYPEYIPDKFRSRPQVSNYAYVSAALKCYKVPHIDFNAYFISQKHKSKYPLYPQYGIHWSNYGSLLAFDSLTGYLEHHLGMDMPELRFRSVQMSDSLRMADNDVIESMNLLWHPATFRMAYPDYHVVFDSVHHKKPRVITVADSFWWYIYSTGIPDATFSDHKFWYYNSVAYPESAKHQTAVADLDLKEEMEKTDAVIILHTEATLENPGNGMIDQLFRLYYPGRVDK